MSLRSALTELGHEAKIVASSFECRGKTIILGAHLLDGNFAGYDIPEEVIIYNLEQITPGSPWLTKQYLNLLGGAFGTTSLRKGNRTFELWDYSLLNIDALSKLGIRAKHCPLGYAPVLTQIESVPNPSIDVLHYGSLNNRREYILRQLESRGILVHRAFNEYGISRDALIARSKIILNVHYYNSKVFEMVRCSYLMSNRKCIVSETGNDTAIEKEFESGICFSSYDDIVGNCLGLLADAPRREVLEQAGFEIFSQMRQSDYLRGLL